MLYSTNWFQAANSGKLFADEAAAMYERAITANLKNNMLIHFAYADFEESRLKFEKVHNIYKRLITIQDSDPTLVRCHESYLIVN